ncbi:hypothetical protein ACF08B_39535 [Streptomyces sp. NPDC015139]|uniref:hypothetical protein n=1 Tax=Streptomyces sp. NPDC015139 TaxID=3364942 RepID=UPI0036FAEECA
MTALPQRLRTLVTAGTMAAALTLGATAPATTAVLQRSAAPVANCALPGRTGWLDEGHTTDRTQLQRATGTIRILMLSVDFTDAQASGSTFDYYRQLAPAAAWNQHNSCGRTALAFEPLTRWIRMPQDSTRYGYRREFTLRSTKHAVSKY